MAPFLHVEGECIIKRSPFTNEYISSFCTEMYLVLKSGIGVAEGLLLLFEEERDKEAKEVLAIIHEKVEKGQPLFEAMRAPGVFPSYMLDMIMTGRKPATLTRFLIRSVAIIREKSACQGL